MNPNPNIEKYHSTHPLTELNWMVYEIFCFFISYTRRYDWKTKNLRVFRPADSLKNVIPYSIQLAGIEW